MRYRSPTKRCTSSVGKATTFSMMINKWSGMPRDESPRHDQIKGGTSKPSICTHWGVVDARYTSNRDVRPEVAQVPVLPKMFAVPSKKSSDRVIRRQAAVDNIASEVGRHEIQDVLVPAAPIPGRHQNLASGGVDLTTSGAAKQRLACNGTNGVHCNLRSADSAEKNTCGARRSPI